MKVGIMQPYFFPYIGYFQIMNAVDCWIIFDQVQFVDKGWINRNRILHPSPEKEWQYITLPLAKKNRFDQINEINIHPEIDWRKEIKGKLSIYSKKAPFFREAMALLDECFECEEQNLSLFLANALKVTARTLNINTEFMFMNELNLAIENIEHPGQWAVKISEAIGATQYINPPAGYAIFKEEEFQACGVELLFLQSNLSPYKQLSSNFVPGLSIIDLMMWNDKSVLDNMLRQDFQLLTHGKLSNNAR